MLALTVVIAFLPGWFASSCVSDRDHRLPARCRERASLTGTPPSQWCCRSGNAGPPVGTARRRRAESRIATHRDSSRPGAVPIPGGGVPAPGRASTQSALRRSPRFAGLCRPEVYTFPGITFSWGRHFANERRRTGCVGARQVAGRRCQEEEGGEGSGVPLPARRSAWWRGRHAPCSASAWRLLRLGELLPSMRNAG